jgi:AAA ATPase domain
LDRADGVTALIGVNESGKTNLLLPLWKLNPAREGEIQPTSDYPKTMFGDIRTSPKNYSFVTAEFANGTSEAPIAELAGITPEEAEIVRVKRYYDGRYEVSFPKRSGETGGAIAALEQEERLNDSITAKQPDPCDKEGVVKAVVDSLPKFVYYSNYGNLDSEIYLPHVVQNLERNDLGATEAAKARTLRVLFKFVGLEPKEILELGRDFKDPQNPNREPTPDEIAGVAEKKRVRSILLQSAGSKLTGKFKDWWKQGDYHFRSEADGNHFRIWVSDDRRPDEVELESRSTGLQWFLSFYLVFLVESLGEHKNAILLLDEPGLSLHPLAQRDLSAFFDGLADTNQILYTTHSPFLVDADRLERARKVYVSHNGTTKATPNLRHGDTDPNQAGAAYAVHSALNLSLAESLLLGCHPIIVEGTSDQHYLTAIKALLIGAKKIAPVRELVFPPSGGTKTARVVASILTGRDETLPTMLLDGDEPGKRMARELRSGLYTDAKNKILCINDFTGLENSEIEDLIPEKLFAEVVDRLERTPETPFADVVKAGEPLVGQVEDWAEKQGVTLPEGWKVEVAKRTKKLALTRGIGACEEAAVAKWVKLFEAFANAG